MNPFVLLAIFGVASGAKRGRRKNNKSNAKGGPTQRKPKSVIDILRVQRGRRRVEEPEDGPRVRLQRVLGTDKIGVTPDGERGYVGPQWWIRTGRDLLLETRRRHPDATPEEVVMLLLKQAVPSVDWDGGSEKPVGAHMLEQRLRRLVESSYMGREVDPVEEAVEAPEETMRAPEETVSAMPEGMPLADCDPADSGSTVSLELVPGGDEEPAGAQAPDPEEVSASAPPEVAQEPSGGKTRRGKRGRGGKSSKAAEAKAPKTDAPEAAEDPKTDADAPGDSDVGPDTAAASK